MEAALLLFGSCAMLQKQQSGQVSAMCWDTSQPHEVVQIWGDVPGSKFYSSEFICLYICDQGTAA